MIDKVSSGGVGAYAWPELQEGEASAAASLAGTLEETMLRLEQEADRRRDIARQERRAALDQRHRAIQKGRESARSKMIGGVVAGVTKIAASALSAASSLSGGGAAAEGAAKSAEGAGKLLEGAASLVTTGGELASVAFQHRAELETLDAESVRAGAEGLAEVGREHGEAADSATRSADRARDFLHRVIEGEHARRLAVLRG